jgi:hypothetical protein
MSAHDVIDLAAKAAGRPTFDPVEHGGIGVSHQG